MDPFKIIGHRGACGYCPENTLASFEKAISLGVKWVELDVRFSRDQIPMVIHDRSLSRTTPMKGWVDFTSSDVLRSKGVSRLDEILDLLDGSGVRCYVEIKKAGRENLEQLGSLVANARLDHAISSFDHSYLNAIHQHFPKIALQALFETPPARLPRFIEQLCPFELGVAFRRLDEKAAEKMMRWDYGVCAYTVNDPVDMLRAKRWGLSGVFTDFPDRGLLLNGT